MLAWSMIHLPREPIRTRSLGGENWSIHIGLYRLFGSGSQVFETVGGLLRYGGLGKHDDRKQVAG